MEDFPEALATAVRLLACRDHSTAELALKLTRRGVAEAAVAAVVARLTDKGYLDDRRFAMRWAEAAVEAGRGFGPRLRFELSRRGIEVEIIGDVLATIDSEHDEESTLLNLITTKFPAFDPHRADERERRRMMHYLQRRGFSYGAISRFFRAIQGD